MKRIAFKQIISVIALALIFSMNVDAKKKYTTPSNLSGQARECYQAAMDGDANAQLTLGYCYQE